MKRALPPFPALRAFEAAARHLNFKRAAEELHVTPSAISHQVKVLEDHVGVPLFHRAHTGVALTDAGAAYLPVVGEALDRIAGATERLRAANLSGSLAVSTTAAFAARWLVPRLGGFAAAYPDIDVRISSSARPVDFAREGIDVAIRVGRGDWPGLRADRLMSSTVFPVCGPQVLKGERPLRRPADLRHHTLLHYDYGEDWGRWLRAAGVASVDAARGPRFDDCNLMLQAAADGQGVALAVDALVTDDLASGRLVRLFDVVLLPASWYHLVCPKTWAGRPKIAALRDWMLEEAGLAAETGGPGQERMVAAR